MNSAIVLVGVITYRRPNMLSALLASLEGTIPPVSEVGVVVVDNDVRQSARPAYEAWSSTSRFSSDYFVEPKRGIPFARNRVLAIASGHGVRYVAMVDDDLQVGPEWLGRLFDGVRTSSHAAACGGVRFVAEAETNHIARALIKLRNAEEGRARISTRCCLLDLDFLNKHSLQFDESFALTGGSDTDLFRRIAESHGTIARVDVSLVTEIVPLSRLKMGWHFRRAARVSAVRALQRRKERGASRALRDFAPEAIAKFLVASLQLAASPVAGVEYALRAFKKAGSAYGLTLGCFGFVPEEYSHVHGN